MDKIIGIGSALIDILAHIDNDNVLGEMQLPKGSMQLIDSKRLTEVSSFINRLSPSRATGGSSANTMLGLARLGNSPALISRVGRDENGRFYEASSREAGIETFFVSSDDMTGVASTFISPDGQRTFATHLGAAAGLCADDLNEQMFDGCKYLYIEGYLVPNRPLVERAIALARSRDMKICLDMASYNIVEAFRDYFEELLRGSIDIVFANEEESRAFTGLAPREALDAMGAMCEVVVVKLGKEGAMARRAAAGGDAAETASCPAGEVEHVVDTTVAGDFFAAGFLHALTRGCSLKACLETGSVLSAEVIQVEGTAIPAARWNDIRRRVNDICK